MKLSLIILVMFFSVFPACKAGPHPANDESDFESIPLERVFSGQPKEAVLNKLRPLRLNLIEINEALCDVPFAQKYKDNFGESFPAKDTEEIRRMMALFHQKFVEEKHETPVVAVVVTQGVAEGLNYIQTLSEPMIKNVETYLLNLSQPSRVVDKGIVAVSNKVNQIVTKIAQGSPAVHNLFRTATSKFGLKNGLQVVGVVVPQATAVVNVIRAVANALGIAIDANRTLIRIADSVAKVGRFVKIALRGTATVVGGYADTLAICEFSKGLIGDLEFWELQAKFTDPATERKEYNRLLRRYCASYKQRNKGLEPIGTKCPK